MVALRVLAEDRARAVVEDVGIAARELLEGRGQVADAAAAVRRVVLEADTLTGVDAQQRSELAGVGQTEGRDVAGVDQRDLHVLPVLCGAHVEAQVLRSVLIQRERPVQRRVAAAGGQLVVAFERARGELVGDVGQFRGDRRRAALRARAVAAYRRSPAAAAARAGARDYRGADDRRQERLRETRHKRDDPPEGRGNRINIT